MRAPGRRSAARKTDARAARRWRARTLRATRRRGSGRRDGARPLRANRWSGDPRWAQRLAQELERAVGSLQAHLAAIAPVLRGSRGRPRRPAQSEPHRADGFVRGPAVWPGNAGDRRGPRRTRSLPGAFRHRAHHRLADGAVLLEHFARDSQRAVLEIVRVRDECPCRPARASADLGQELGQESAGAALGAADRLAAASAESERWFSGNLVRNPKRTSGCASRTAETSSSSLLSVTP